MFRKYLQFTGQLLKSYNLPNQSIFSGLKCENQLVKRWAGHSKWQNIKHTKEANDKNKSLNFSRISRQIILAVREAGDDPALNSKLRNLIAESQKLNMPKATVERAIKDAHTQITSPYWVLLSSPSGAVLAFEVIFANKKLGFLQGVFGNLNRKIGFKLENRNSNFCKEQGVVITEPLQGVDNAYEKALEDGIEVGVEEVYENDDKTLLFECLPDRVESVSKQLSSRGYDVQNASVELEFNNYVHMTADEMKVIDDAVAKMQSQYSEILRAVYNSDSE